MAALVNGTTSTPTSDITSPTGPMSNPGKQSTKGAANASTKNNDGGRKQSTGGNDGSQRRSGPPKAWQSGMNPITHRSNNSNQQNGAGQHARTNQKSGGYQELASVEKVASDRLTFLLANFMGLNASITVRNGDVFTGIFFGVSSDSQELVYLLKMVQQTKAGDKSEGPNGVKDLSLDFVGVGDDHSMTFEGKDVIDLAVEGVTLSTQDKQMNGSATGFRTDTDISGNLAYRERELQRWTGSADDENVNMALEDSNGASWDQFKANEKLFGLKSDYDENIYTTALDRNTPQYRQNEARAQKIAREIEGNSPNPSRARDLDDEAEADEEDKYSGVRRQGNDYPPLQTNQPNKYMPPARRPPSGQPTVPGVPVDPAIISSQVAQPESSPKAKQQEASLQAAPTTTAPPTKTAEAALVEAKQEPTKEPVKEPVVPKAQNATANVEAEVLDSFRTFAEKQKTKIADDRQKRVRHEKDIKLNDLKGFSKNFKLHTPVPNDLVPILAKEKSKQDAIVEKARREAEEHTKSPPKPTKSAEEITKAAVPADVRRDSARGPPNNAERTDFTNFRQQHPPRGPQGSISGRDRNHQAGYPFPTSPQGSSGYLSHRLAETQRTHKAGIPTVIPTPLPIQSAQKPSGRSSGNMPYVANSQSSSTVRTPTSATSTKFNVQALEFKPNPAANAFKPTTAPTSGSSPKAKSGRGVPLAANASEFFGNKKPVPISERVSISDHFNPLKRLKEKAQKEGKAKDYVSNGGIVYAHATPVTWSTLRDDEVFKSYKELFSDPPATSSGVSPQPSTASPMNSNQAHVHQLPVHLQQQNMPHAANSHHSHYPVPPQQALFPNGPGAPHGFEDPRMHGSPSGSAYPASRLQNNFIAYPSPMGPAVQYPFGQPIPHMIAPGAPQTPNFRPHPNAPQYMPSPGQQLAAPMMVQQGSQGSYMSPQAMAMPHMPVYGPAATPAYSNPSQPPSGYPSPGRAPMMMHQGSYQGQAPSMHAANGQYGQQYYAQQQPPHMNAMRGFPSPQPPYSHSPQQPYHYPPQPQRMPSHGYGNHAQATPQVVPVQQTAPSGPAMENNESMK